MSTIREIYFSKLPIVEKSSNFSVAILNKLLIKFNNLKDELDLTKNFDSKMLNESLFEKAFNEILNGKMFEYVVNESTFDANKFYVDENVLIPRQETEELLNRFYNYIDDLKFDTNNLNIGDICTGSGCLGISFIKKYVNSKMYLSDIDSNALNVAKKNAKLNNVECEFLLGNMLSPFIEKKIKLDCIICNPPYIENIEQIDKRTLDQEPHQALLAKPSIKYYKLFLSQIKKVIKKRFLIAFEIGENMKQELTALVRDTFPMAKFKFEKDLDGKWRFLFIYSMNKYKSARDALLNHGVIGFPTETVMGLGILYDDKVAFERLNMLKKRPESKPYSLMLSSIYDIQKYAYISEKEMMVAKAFLPGPLTLLLKKKKLPKWVSLDSEFVGIRIPDIPAIRKTIRNVKKPLLAPSANISGEKPALTNKELKQIFGNGLDFILKGDALNSKASTVVLIDDDVKIIREGPISKEQILEVLNNENSNR